MERFLKVLTCAAFLAPAAALAGPGDKAVSTIDAYYIPKADLDSSAPGFADFSDDGDGFGIRGLVRAGPVVIITGEYQTTSYDDSSQDFDQMRLGVGAMSAVGLGGYVEYVNAELSNGGSREADGFGLHGRYQANVMPALQLYADIGWLMLDSEDNSGFSEDADGLEFTLGGAFAFTPVVGAFLDVRRTNIETDQSQVETEFMDVRVGGRIMFGG